MNSKTFPAPRRVWFTASAFALGGFMLAGTACSHRPIIVQAAPATIIQTAAPAPVETSTPAVIVMKDAPPSPHYEAMTPQPSPETVWIPGYWAWSNGERQWITGHWDVPPRVGAMWVAPRWDKQGDGYVFVQGYWR